MEYLINKYKEYWEKLKEYSEKIGRLICFALEDYIPGITFSLEEKRNKLILHFFIFDENLRKENQKIENFKLLSSIIKKIFPEIKDNIKSNIKVKKDEIKKIKESLINLRNYYTSFVNFPV